MIGGSFEGGRMTRVACVDACRLWWIRPVSPDLPVADATTMRRSLGASDDPVAIYIFCPLYWVATGCQTAYAIRRGDADSRVA
jgi:hypothetical protein